MNTTLIIDGNWLLMSRLFACKEYFDVQNDETERRKGTAELEDLLCKSINLVINRFSDVVDNFIIVGDGGSWRKDVKKPKGFETVYKGNRTKDSELDWKAVYKALDDILEQAAELGVTVSKAGGIEGDDWIFHWSRYLNNRGTNCIIWSSDCDLKQLVQVKNGVFTAWLNESQKGGLPGLVLHNDLADKPMNDIDMFMTLDNSNPLLDQLRSMVAAVTYINPDDIVCQKVVCGDRGDNIKSLVTVQHGSRQMRITEAKWEGLKNDLSINNVKEFVDHKDDICRSCGTFFKKIDVPVENTREMFDYNLKLVYLNESTVPEEVQKKMDEVKYRKADLAYIKSNYKVLCKLQKDSENIEDIFEGI